jgi:superfamily II DNA or RNA helicase
MKAAEELLKQETGVLVAPTAFGKTVVGAWLIAQRKVNTLVLVHTRQLMDQWINRLETLLLALPISWKGTLAQYTGRLHRIREGKRMVTIYDYADLKVPMLRRMFQRRLRGYKHLGYRMDETFNNSGE